VASGSPRQIAEGMLGQFGWSGQFSCLDSLWNVESGWNPTAENPNSGAYGIPQALPGSKMASAGPDRRRDADPVGPAVHPVDLRLPLRRMVARGGHRLVLAPIYSKRTLSGIVMRRSSGRVTVMTPKATARPMPMNA
jgi:hypothetical protein